MFSLCNVELILAERGVVVTYASIRHWCRKFGAEFATRLRRCRPRPGDTWHLDEVFIRIGGVLHYLWRAVDQHGVVLDILVQEKRDGAAAKRFFRRLLAGLRDKPKRLITDGLRSYGVARRALLPDVKHRTSRYLNNRAENSHRPTRQRERQMQRFKSSDRRRTFSQRMPLSTATSGHGVIVSAPSAIGVPGPKHFGHDSRRRLSSWWDEARHTDGSSVDSLRPQLTWQCQFHASSSRVH